MRPAIKRRGALHSQEKRGDAGVLVGIRGAIGVRENSERAILEATRELLDRVIRANGVEMDKVAGVFFTSTSDLTAAFPARALREMGWDKVPAICAQELEIPNGMRKVVRVLVLVNGDSTSMAKHQYIGRARELRPDL